MFAITYAGIGKSGKHEYHIINNNSGTFMTYPEGAPKSQQLTGNVLSPSNERTGWSVSLDFSFVIHFDLANTMSY